MTENSIGYFTENFIRAYSLYEVCPLSSHSRASRNLGRNDCKKQEYAYRKFSESE